MGAPIEQYEQQQIKVATPDVHIIAQGDDPYLLWATGVVVPIVLAVLGLWVKRHTGTKEKE